MLQLWTSSGGKEFALRLGESEAGIFVAATHLGADYPFLIEEFSCSNDTNCNWETILQEKADKWMEAGRIREVIQSRESPAGGHARDLQSAKRISTPRLKRIRPTLKCGFCRLMYVTEVEKLEHEKMWHSTKIQARIK
jgi:hypothetical protein